MCGNMFLPKVKIGSTLLLSILGSFRPTSKLYINIMLTLLNQDFSTQTMTTNSKGNAHDYGIMTINHKGKKLNYVDEKASCTNSPLIYLILEYEQSTNIT